MVYRIVYISKATPSLDDKELDKILASSRKNNPKLDVTGLMLFFEGSFFQVLEGEKSQVESLYRYIELDSRHITVKRLQEGEVSGRLFGDWSMAYTPISKQDKQKLIGDGDFFSKFSPSNSLDVDTKSLTTFIAKMVEKMIR